MTKSPWDILYLNKCIQGESDVYEKYNKISINYFNLSVFYIST